MEINIHCSVRSRAVSDDHMMHRMILLLVGVLGFAGVGNAQIVQDGQCSTITLMQSFVLDSFIGQWYEIGKSSTQNADCSNLVFSNSGVNIAVSNPSVVNNFLQTSTAEGTHTTGTAQFSLTWSGSTTATDFWILGSDYDNYTIAINCADISTTQRELNVWQLGRSVTSYDDQAVLTAANTVLGTIGMTVSGLTVIDHSTAACTQLPVIGAGQPVILDGLCNNAAISVVQNFEVQNFTGTWHEISSYYSANAVGSCARADYTLVGSAVEVVNSQVLNQRLDSISGTATLIGTDGSGRLSVTLNVQGMAINQELLILDTDYTGYALSYSCFDISATQRQVNAWILSREKELSPASQTEVDRVIASLIDLNDAYFIGTDQSDSGCFYFPVHQSGVPVVFPGTCEDTIAAVPSFNLAQFTGTWHEVEAYPKEQQTGSCVNHVFSSGIGNSLNLVSSQVVDQQATTASGSVTLTSTDSSGRLTLTLNTGTQDITFPYWILAVDYDDYALAYSCVQLTTGSTAQRAVYSWKLSREQTLSTAANTAIDTLMTSVAVVDPQYFETVDQTDAGCFYYPDAAAGTPVVFPGLCDTTISVQANFNPVAYMGLWHDISSYPSTFQFGTCNNANYTLTGDVVDVFNTQVINQQLDTINGVAIIPDATEPAKLLVTFPIAGTNQTVSTEYWVLATDHTSYSLVYSCTNIPSTNQRMVFSWKLSRNKTLSAEAITAINAVTATVQVLRDQYYVDQDQSAAGCFYFPEATGEPVVFPGLCDDTIAAVPSFNLAMFTGIWYEVEAYPKEQQTGSCVNHAFNIGIGNSLNLVSNQVVDREATTANGNVILISSDGSARLILNLNTGGQVISIPYWILATNYTDYALAYSCVQLTPDFRSVHSWKLSREQNISADGNTAIDAAMATVQVLDQQYFEDVDQSEAGCFVYPDIPAGDPIILEGLCGTVTPVANFQSAEFNGTWHEIARYGSARQSGNCAANQFISTAENTFTLTQTIVYNERLTTVSGNANLAADGSGTLTATLSDGDGLSYTTTIYILDTDNTEYALLYSCENIEGTNNRQIFSWKLSRSQSGFSQIAIDRISEVVNNTDDLLERYYQSTGQTSADCFYYPVFEGTPEAIMLPGTCPVVTGVSNFNPTDYLGDWYDVARYPVASQFGTCSRANYSIVDGVITIRNTMVVDGALREQHGIGRLSVTGTGLLRVTILLDNGEEHVLNHYILDTDYFSYSLVYACRNVGDGTSQVYSWKLSRTPTLTPEANTAINNFITNTQGLLEEYYEAQTHTDQDCFYVPELVPGQSVLFPGSCEPVTSMPGFVQSQYLGWWHEYERYPSDDHPGQCTSANFVQSGDLINVVETGVYNGVANETMKTATLSADGIITITGDGESREWAVITTDYNTYSLLYSCENVTTSSGVYRRVWSAKHSKADSLSTIAQNAMAPFIVANPVLHEHLYEVVNQSSSACFHHREDANELVILRGQCDNNIPVQENFDLSRFVDTWYHIERYPYTANNDDTCTGSRLTGNGDSISVQHWQVLDGTLDVREGSATVDGATITVRLSVEGSEETVPIEVHILTTDYDGYALAYTCTNINSFQRAVGAFKLSRTRSLNNEANYAIKTYMATREELHQPYFISISQHRDCDEPSSGLLVKSSILVMLVSVILNLVM